MSTPDETLRALQAVPEWDEMLLRAGLQDLAERQRELSPAEFQAFLTLCQRQQHQQMERVMIRTQSPSEAS